jgi:type VI protein secretion system component VasK
VHALKATQDPPRLRYRERRGAPWWLVLGPEAHGKSALLGAAPGAREVESGEPGEPRFFVADDAAFIEIPADYHMRP